MSSQTEADTRYNGWKNYPTWAVALWIGNEQWSQEYAQDRVAYARENAPACEQVTEGIWTAEQAVRFNLADAIQEWVKADPEEYGWMPDLGATMAADLLGYALDHVDWHEIADNLLSD